MDQEANIAVRVSRHLVGTAFVVDLLEGIEAGTVAFLEWDMLMAVLVVEDFVELFPRMLPKGRFETNVVT